MALNALIAMLKRGTLASDSKAGEGEGVFVKGWSIVSLTIIGKKYPLKRERILRELKKFERDERVSARSKVKKAIEVLTDETKDLPKGRSKSGQLSG